jgi:peptide/nickel transport system permease protein
MARYLVRQTLLSLGKLFVFVTLMFFFIQIMIPGDFVDQYALLLSAAQREDLRAQLGLNLPIGQRYLTWMQNLARLDLGTSFSGEPIVDILKAVVPATLLVFVTGTAIAFLIGMWLGKRTAWHGSGFFSRLTTLGSITLYTSFPPWLAYLLSYLLTRGRSFVVMGEVGGLRGVSFRNLNIEAWAGTELSPPTVAFRIFLTMSLCTLFFILLNLLLERLTRKKLPVLVLLLLIAGSTVGSWYLLGMQVLAFDIMRLSWLAILTYTLLSFGETMLIMQSSMTEILKEPYIITAHAKGLPASVVREKHAARNALLPVLSRLVISLPYLITGVVIIESSVGWPGMGTSMWNALYWQNMTLVMAILMIVGVLSLIARLVLDVVIAYLDPRIRYEQQQASLT